MTEAVAYDPHSTAPAKVGEVRSGLAVSAMTPEPAEPTHIDNLESTIEQTAVVTAQSRMVIALIRNRLLGQIDPPADDKAEIGTERVAAPQGRVAETQASARDLLEDVKALHDELQTLNEL